MTGYSCMINKFTYVTYILNEEKLPSIPTKWFIMECAFQCYVKEEKEPFKNA